jgi:L-asparaginase
MKRILLIATGGTISCRDTGLGLAPALTGEELLEFLPAAAQLCRITVINPFTIDSTNITTANRVQIARLIQENYDRYDGFVITHGTDSLGYTAALLYHMCKNLNKPVILTGSQKPIGVPDSDAEKNLMDSLRVAAGGYVGVAAVMYGKIIRGNHVVKVHSGKPEGFESINAPLMGTIDEDGTVRLTMVPKLGGEPEFVEEIDQNFMVLKLVPDMDTSIFSFLEKYNKVILEAYGAGGIPIRLEKVVQKLILSGTKVYITTQCLEGGVNLSLYEVGRRAEAMGAISLGHRTTEDAIAAIQCGDI